MEPSWGTLSLATWPIHLIMIVGLFALGTVVGSFLNVCIYRIPWEKSVIWPGSRCPKCLSAIAAQDNIPIVSWIALRGECRTCGTKISARYPLIETLVGLLFVGIYLVDVVFRVGRANAFPRGVLPVFALAELDPAMLIFHMIFVALLVAATFIDYDLQVIPDEITVPGMAIAIALGALFPFVRPDPADATTHWGGFWVGVIGLLVGGGFTYVFRTIASFVFRREAMGFGDVMLMGMIGAFLGWQTALLTFFFSAFIGIGHAIWKIGKTIKKLWNRHAIQSRDRELPLGPYLSMAAVVLMFSWGWIWPKRLETYFDGLRMLFWVLLGL